MFKRISSKEKHVHTMYSLMNMTQLRIIFNELNNFRFSTGKFGGKHRNQQTITFQVLAELNKIWSYLIFIKLYSANLKRLFNKNIELCIELN